MATTWRRDHTLPATADEVAAFETDVLTGFVLTRAAAGLSGGGAGASDVPHIG